MRFLVETYVLVIAVVMVMAVVVLSVLGAMMLAARMVRLLVRALLEAGQRVLHALGGAGSDGRMLAQLKARLRIRHS
ncbi:MAG TPA: hypothetical protein VFY29_07015 [Terriglobia bacterium]|nr:hypothetical protein [Terriglobia bacterium]